MSEPRLIKRTAARRFYDTSTCDYLTYGDLRSLVLDRIAFRIVETSGEDVTNQALWTMLTGYVEELAQLGPEVPTRLVRVLGRCSISALQLFLEQMLTLFESRSDEFQ